MHTDRQALGKHLLVAWLSVPPFSFLGSYVVSLPNYSAWVTGRDLIVDVIPSGLVVCNSSAQLSFSSALLFWCCLLSSLLPAFVQAFVVSVQEHHSSSSCSVTFSFRELPCCHQWVISKFRSNQPLPKCTAFSRSSWLLTPVIARFLCPFMSSPDSTLTRCWIWKEYKL